MKKIMILLEWGAYPIAQLDDNGFILDDIGAEELGFDETFCDEVQDLQDRYDNLFIDNGIEFRYIGDEKPKEKEIIKEKYRDISNIILGKLSKEYEITVSELEL